MNNREALIILHRRLKMGGIETGSVEMMKNALSHNKRTIWVGNIDKVYDKNFGDVIDNPNKVLITPTTRNIKKDLSKNIFLKALNILLSF